MKESVRSKANTYPGMLRILAVLAFTGEEYTYKALSADLGMNYTTFNRLMYRLLNHDFYGRYLSVRHVKRNVSGGRYRVALVRANDGAIEFLESYL